MGGVSISESRSVDLEAIIAGGAGFADRLKAFSEAAKAAEDAKAAAATMLEEAATIKAAADQQLAENKATAEELRIALADAERLKIELAAKIGRVDDIMRG